MLEQTSVIVLRTQSIHRTQLSVRPGSQAELSYSPGSAFRQFSGAPSYSIDSQLPSELLLLRSSQASTVVSTRYIVTNMSITLSSPTSHLRSLDLVLDEVMTSDCVLWTSKIGSLTKCFSLVFTSKVPRISTFNAVHVTEVPKPGESRAWTCGSSFGRFGRCCSFVASTQFHSPYSDHV
jgi:hypothetical protein